MPTLLDIAQHADVPVEGVLRVMNGDPVSEDVAARVRRTMEELGSPHESIVDSLKVLSPARVVQGEIVDSATTPSRISKHREAETLERTRDTLLEQLARTAAELEETVPQGVGSVVYEAVRVEVAPVAQRVNHMDALVDQLTEIVRQLGEEVGAERRERLEDLKLLVDLIVTSWRRVDARLGRVETMLQRLESQRQRP